MRLAFRYILSLNGLEPQARQASQGSQGSELLSLLFSFRG